MKRTTSQNRLLYQLFSRLNIDEDNKQMLVLEFTDNRTSRTSEMELIECKQLIQQLEAMIDTSETTKKRYADEELQKNRREIFKLMYDCGFISSSDTTDRKLFVINAWIKKKMNLEKDLNSLTFDELLLFIKQLRTVRRIYIERGKSIIKHNLN